MLIDGITIAAGADAAYDIAGYTLSTPANADVIMRFVAPRAFSIPANMAGTVFNVGVNPSSAATLTFKKNGVSAGVVTISTGGVATLPTQAAVSFVIGEVLTLEVTAANSIDNIAWTVKTVGA